MIVLAIFGAMIAIGLPRLTRTDTNIRAVARQMTVLIKETRTHARMKGKAFRIAFEVGKQNGKYWVESSPKTVLLKDPRAVESSEEDEKNRKEGEESSPNGFQEDKSFLKGKKELPGKLKFISIETQAQEDAVTEGTAYIHFFPEGLIESAVIQMGDGQKLIWTLSPNPITGKTDIIQKEMSLKEIEDQ